MTEQWDGVPENPERDGWHWVRPNIAPAYEPECWQWCAAAEAFARDASDLNDPWFPQHYDYLGPCALPSAIAALRADNARLREAHDELSRYSDAEITRLRRLWTYLQEAAADLDADEPMKAAEWLAEFDQAEKARAALAGAPSHE